MKIILAKSIQELVVIIESLHFFAFWLKNGFNQYLIDLRVGKVTASSLNIRSGPDVENEKITPSLTKGTKLTILDAKDWWYKVRTEVEGWVFAKHVK